MSDRTFSVWVPGEPAPKGSRKAVPGRGRGAGRVFLVADSKREAPWARRVRAMVGAEIARAVLPQPVFGEYEPVRVDLAFRVTPPAKAARRPWSAYPTGRKDDVDKLARCALDAMDSQWFRGRLLAAGVLTDDGQVVELHATKRYARAGEETGVQITVTPIDTAAESGERSLFP